MKFEESKVINELYKSKVKKGSTGFVADDIWTLKNAVSKNKEEYFGEVFFPSSKKSLYEDGRRRPFLINNKEGYLFYPATSEEVFGDNYIDYREMYNNIDIQQKMSYSEFANLWNAKDEDDSKWSQFLFSAEVWAHEKYRGRFSPELPSFLKKGYTTVLIKAPNLKAAYLTLDEYLENVVGWEKYGEPTDNNFEFNSSCDDIRYFGEFSFDKSYLAIKKDLKLFNSYQYYKLGPTARKISYKDLDKIPYNKSLNNFFENHVKGNLYKNEITDIVYYNRFKPTEKSLKERVEESFKEAGVKTWWIYESERKALEENFNSNIKKIIKIAKKFESEDHSDLERFAESIQMDGNATYEVDRPNLQIEDYGELREDYKGNWSEAKKSDYIHFSKRDINKSIANLTIHFNGENTIHNRNSFVVIPKSISFSDVDTILHQYDHKTYDSFEVGNNVCIPTENDLRKHMVNEWRDNTKPWYKLLDNQEYAISDLTKYDVESIKNYNVAYCATIENVEAAELEGHNCVKIHIYEERDRYDNTPYMFCSYKFILEKMKDYKHHLVKIEQLGRYKENDEYYRRHNYEHVNLYFAKDTENKDYGQTYTETFWKQLLKGDWW